MTVDHQNHLERGDDDATTLYQESIVTNESTLLNPSRLHRMLLARLANTGHQPKKKALLSGHDTQELKRNEDEIKEDPYRWLILVGGFLAQAISMATLSCIMQEYYDRQVFRGSVDVTQLSFVGTIGFSFCGLMGPVSQIFTSILGVRWVMLIGTVLMSGGLVLASFSVEVWHLYITQSVIHGMGAALLYVVSMAISPQWFRRRGLALGVMVSGSGVGGLVMPFIMTELNETLGGAWCYRILGIVTFGIGLMSTLLLKEKEVHKVPLRLRHVIDIGLCKDVKFVIWCIAGNLNMLAYFIPAFYLPSHANKLGLLPSQGSTLVAVFSAVNVVGRILSGYLGDHLGAVNVNIVFLLVCGFSSLFIWPFATSYATLMVFIVTYGFMSGAVFSLLAPITATITGMDRYPSGIGLYLFFMTAARLGPTLAGTIQSYMDKESFFALQVFTGFAFISSALVTILLKHLLKPGLFHKV